MLRLIINGEAAERRAATVAELLREEGLDAAPPPPGRPGRRIAVARNGALVPASQWAATRLETGDAIEIVRPVAGG